MHMNDTDMAEPKKIRLCLLFGGVSEEHEVSLLSARSVLSHLNRERYDITAIGITKEGSWRLFEGTADQLTEGAWQNFAIKKAILPPSRPGCLWILTGDRVEHRPLDVVFPVMHGKHSEDGTLQGLLELTGLSYVGCDCLSSAVCMDKATTKLVLKNYGIPQAVSLVADRREIEKGGRRLAVAVEAMGYPVFVKPSASGSSCGVTKVTESAGLMPALELALQSGRRVLVEKAVPGVEVEVAVLGNEDPLVSVPGEIAPGSDFYDYDTKYKKDSASYYIPARISDRAMAQVRQLAGKIYKALGCRGLARVDFFVAGEQVIFNEINTLPGFTAISMYPKMIGAMGIGYPELLDRLIACALEK